MIENPMHVPDVGRTRAVRRNDIVSNRRDQGPPFVHYGRVARIRDGVAEVLFARDGTVEVPVGDLDVHNDYPGFVVWGPEYEVDGERYRDRTVRRMPTLRRLKQIVQRREGRGVWARERRRKARRTARRCTPTT